MEHGEATLKGIADFAPECAMMKVLGSEVLDYVVDEAVQIHGGMGYSAETRAELAYRDARINRIFEGTNEINRMLTVDMILKKAMKGEMDLMTPAMAVANELTGVPDFSPSFRRSIRTSVKLCRQYEKSHPHGGGLCGTETYDEPRKGARDPHEYSRHGHLALHH